ncbi:hypothetical protein [Halobacillus karajensis]|uniref:Citrate transporter-like domain-containing protein n=1 Tax=Halobacillus karajensis TaxID=195088 RepID=A0A024P6G2_9BACI|nr:hypothetical protein [Halobacillus karajensis]CDQ20589.1 hypothetical protein BN982_02939 [Halobacillus karajensis]CDQ23942.1 hypothetical protein BN983_02198 [Halobacillus karajensis]CDQ27420.1 hypothetical protein BN981_01679 [Halobacillus karajensis]
MHLEQLKKSFRLDRGMIVRPISNYLYIFYSFVFILNVVHVFWDHPTLYSIIGVLGMVMTAISFPRADRVFKILGVVLLGAGAFFFFSGEAVWRDIPTFFAGNIGLLFLLSMLPWMNSVVKAGRYNKLLQSLLGNNARGLGSLYIRSEMTMVSLAAFLNLSSATIAQDLLKEQLKDVKMKIKNSFILMATLRGYSLALLWSPLEILLATSIFITGANYLEVLPWMLLIAILGIAMDSFIGKMMFRKEGINPPSDKEKAPEHSRKKLTTFIFALVLFLSIVVFLGNIIQLDFLFAVTIAIFPFAFLWAVFVKRTRSFLQIGWSNWKWKTNHLSNFIVLLLSLSFLTETLNQSPYLQYLQDPIVSLEGNPFLIMLFIQAAFLVMTVLGVHPLATMGIFGGVSELLLGAFPPVTLTILLASCAIATVPSAPYGLIVTMTSVALRMNPYQIVLRNLPYSLFLGFLGGGISLLTLLIY